MNFSSDLSSCFEVTEYVTPSLRFVLEIALTASHRLLLRKSRRPGSCDLVCKLLVCVGCASKKRCEAGDLSLGRLEATVKVALEHHAQIVGAPTRHPWAHSLLPLFKIMPS